MSRWIDKLTVGEAVDRAAQRWGDLEALFFEGRRWSFTALRDDCDRAARGLIQAGVQPGDKVALWLDNRPEWIHILFAAAKVGAVLVPINTRFRTNDLEYVVRQSDATTLITARRSGPIDYLSMVRGLIPELDAIAAPAALQSQDFPKLRRVIVVDEALSPGTLRWTDVVEGGEAVPEADRRARQESVDPDATTIMLYTSGTTGFPKGVMHCHDLLRNVTDQASRQAIRPPDAILTYLPLFHAFGLYEGPYMSVVSGARQVLMERFEAGEALRLIEAERIALIHGFDTHFRELMNHPDLEKTDRSTIRSGICSTGLASSEPTARRAQQLLCDTISAYGMTELHNCAAQSFPLDSEDDRCTMSGAPMPGYTFRVIDPDTGAEQPHGTPGEILVHGYGVMQGYYKKPEETAKAIDGEGWMHTGDRGIERADGTIRFLGRYKDMLKVGGENVDAAEVEALVLTHEAVAQVAVVGVPDERLAEVACACVRLKPGAQLDAAELSAHCKGKVATFKIPRHVLFLDEYPMTSSGKVQKFKLRDIALTQLGLSLG